MLFVYAVLLAIPAVAVDDGPRIIQGVALFSGTDRSAAGVTLLIVEQSDPRFAAVVDDQGRFHAQAPPNWHIPQPDGTEMACWAVAEPPGRWQIEPIESPPFQVPEGETSWAAAKGLARAARAIWQKGFVRVDCPEPGEVDVLVRGHDGQAVADRPVVVVPDAEAFGTFRSATARFTGRTDGEGRFRMRWFEGTRTLRITVPGEGFATTPPIEVAAGRTTAVATLPLTSFGSIAGRLAPGLVGPGVEVFLDPRIGESVPYDKDGRFAIREVPPGRYVVRVTKENETVLAGRVTVWVAPGEKVEGVQVDAIPPPTPEEVEEQKQTLEQINGPRGEDGEDELWVEGNVRDTSGRAVVGADVFVRAVFNGGMRWYEDVRHASTDAQGHYAIRGPARRFVGGLVVVAKVAGRPPAVAHAEADSLRRHRPSKCDLTLADSGGSIRLLVLSDGKPIPNATVVLSAEGAATTRNHIASRGGGASQPALDAIASPTATTDTNGVAHFADLLPGLYTARGYGPGGIAVANGLPVAAGREAEATLATAPARHVVRFQVIRPDGRPVTDQTVGLNFGRGGQANGITTLKLNGEGVGEQTLEPAGLWSVLVTFRDAPSQSFPVREFPHDEARALFPVSPAGGDLGLIRLVAVHRTRQTGSLLVRLLDADGKPARGAVGCNGLIGSTDERGEIRFESLSAGKVFVSGHLEGLSPPPFPSAGPMPAEETLRGRFALVPSKEAEIVPGRETTLELRANALGYLRGTLTPADGRRTADYSVSPWYDRRVVEPARRYDRSTGQFLAGPFPSGPTTVQMLQKVPDETWQQCGQQAIEVVAGEVVHVDLKPGEPEPSVLSPSKALVRLGLGGIRVNPGAPEAPPLTVFLPDGVTPAFAAQAVLYEPGQEQPSASGISDAGGRLTWWETWRRGNTKDKPPGLVETPMLVVSLPGRHGATVVPLGEGPAPRLVLPPAIDVVGNVKIAGRPPLGDGSQVRVVATHQGRGVLDAALSPATTAGPDGRFTFVGLTPGRYLVQAARDGIWVSEAVELRVDPEQIPPPISLQIPAPGETVTLEFVDRAGRPLAGESFTVNRPDGPFRSLWPPTLQADASGRLTLRGLEAGPHSVSISGTRATATFEVGEGSGRPTVKRLVLERPLP